MKFCFGYMGLLISTQLLPVGAIAAVQTADPALSAKASAGFGDAAQATSQPKIDLEDTIRYPIFSQTPSVQDMADAYPTHAQIMEKEGGASIRCTVSNLRLVSCSVLEEAPLDFGFGAAALDVARKFKFKPLDRDGVPVEGRLWVHNIVWRLAR